MKSRLATAPILLGSFALLGCRLAKGTSWDDEFRHLVIENLAAVLIQFLFLLLSIKICRRVRSTYVAPFILGGFLVAHPGVYLAFNRSWIIHGDCGAWTLSVSIAILFASLLTLGLQDYLASRRDGKSDAEG
ncbi:MAG: hypothetical protein JSS66_09050 [Armatimonadetes bacterium]|nr:hypothetical protein [Armatimonadota bacterium]